MLLLHLFACSEAVVMRWLNDDGCWSCWRWMCCCITGGLLQLTLPASERGGVTGWMDVSDSAAKAEQSSRCSTPSIFACSSFYGLQRLVMGSVFWLDDPVRSSGSVSSLSSLHHSSFTYSYTSYTLIRSLTLRFFCHFAWLKTALQNTT